MQYITLYSHAFEPINCLKFSCNMLTFCYAYTMFLVVPWLISCTMIVVYSYNKLGQNKKFAMTCVTYITYTTRSRVSRLSANVYLCRLPASSAQTVQNVQTV